MTLTTAQIARVLGCNAVNAWKAVRRWQARGVVVALVPTGRRPTLGVAVGDVGRMVGLCDADVLRLAGVEGAA